jgi:hypothetical protein
VLFEFSLKIVVIDHVTALDVMVLHIMVRVVSLSDRICCTSTWMSAQIRDIIATMIRAGVYMSIAAAKQ